MKINPVLSSGIKTRMRGWRGPTLMSAYVGVVLGMFYLIYMQNTGAQSSYGYVQEASAIGANLYSTMAILQLAMIVLTVPSMTAGAIAGERERQTLDLLLSSNMSVTRIVFGKLFSNVIFMVFLIIISAPLFAIIYLFGGMEITGLLLLIGYLIVCTYTCASVGLFFSSLFKKTSLATLVSYLFLLFFGVATFIGGMINMSNMQQFSPDFYNQIDKIIIPLLAINPLYGLLEILSKQGAGVSMIFNIGYMGSGANYNYIIIAAVFMLVLSLVLNIASIIITKPINKFSFK